MKVIWLLIFLFALPLTTFSQATAGAIAPKLSLTGTVKEITAELKEPDSKEASYATTVTVSSRLTNTGADPIILLQPLPTLKRATITKLGYKGLPEKSDILADYHGGHYWSSFFMDTKKWKEVQDRFDNLVPPEKLPRILHPGESLTFETAVYFYLPVKFENDSMSFIQNQTLGLLKQLSPVDLKIEFETWSLLSLGKSFTGKKDKLVRKLRKRWKSSGYLWTDDIQGQTIPVNFNSVIFKTLIN